MYLPAAHRIDEPVLLHDFIRRHPLGHLVINGPDGLHADPIPLLLDVTDAGAATLRGHVARANPLWRAADGGREAMVIFTGDGHYITPSWYETKRSSGQVVPTWNYTAVHAWGILRAIDDKNWLRQQVNDLTNRHEAGRDDPWQVSDAPPDYIDQMLTAIVGIELPIRRLEGKWKVSQNRPETDRRGVVEGLRREDGPKADAMADLVEQTLRR